MRKKVASFQVKYNAIKYTFRYPCLLGLYGEISYPSLLVQTLPYGSVRTRKSQFDIYPERLFKNKLKQISFK